MSTVTIKLIKTDSDFLEKVAHRVTVNNEEWFYMPFWFHKEQQGVFHEYKFEDLPDYVKNQILSQRNGNQTK